MTDRIMQALETEYSKKVYGDLGQKFIRLAQKGEWEKLGEELNAAESEAARYGAEDVALIHYGFCCYAFGRAGINESGLEMAEARLSERGVI